MFNATYFTYDGVFSGTYGLMLADFEESPVVETAAFSPVLSTIKPILSNRFFHNGIKYEEHPQHQFSIVSEAEIPDFIRREILSWLIGRREFKQLQIHQTDLEEYYYNCVFTNAELIYINGRCHGFRITANFDSQYARGQATVVKVAKAGTHTVKIENRSDIKDNYVYPIVRFTGGSIDIVNTTDDSQRHFTFADLAPTEIVTVDNEVKHISSSIGGEKLSNFTSKNWLRLRPGYNTLTIVASGEVTITCPHYAMIGY